jgi:hypothetical protein
LYHASQFAVRWQNLLAGLVHSSFAALEAQAHTLSDEMQRWLRDLEQRVVDVYDE